MSTVKVNTISTWTGSDISIETGKTVSGTASQFKMTDVVQGDVLYGSAADTLSRLAPGTSGQVLQTQGAGANPVWAADDSGKVLQVKQTSLNTTVATTSTTYVASGITLTMTGIASTDSKFLLSVDGGQMSTSNNTYECLCTFFVDTGSGAAEVSDTGPYELMKKYDNVVPHSALYLHAPSTTSDTTYSVHYKVNSSPGGQTASFNIATARVTFTVMELSS